MNVPITRKETAKAGMVPTNIDTARLYILPLKLSYLQLDSKNRRTYFESFCPLVPDAGAIFKELKRSASSTIELSNSVNPKKNNETIAIQIAKDAKTHTAQARRCDH